MSSLHKFFAATRSAGLLTLLLALSFSVKAESPQEAEPAGRAMVLSIEAEVVDVDPEFRQVTLKGPMGNVVTVTAGKEVTNFKDIKVGDILAASYLAALEGELREPTAEELENPWVVVEDSAESAAGEPAAVGKARLIRAVCTIEGMNRALGTVTVKDPRGKLHMIGDVEPEKMDGVTLGQTIVLVYTEALAISLEKVSD